jgi:multidrug efflux pump
VLTLYTTPVIYLAFDRMGRRFGGQRKHDAGEADDAHPTRGEGEAAHP